jgi:hypothetical protein
MNLSQSTVEQMLIATIAGLLVLIVERLITLTTSVWKATVEKLQLREYMKTWFISSTNYLDNAYETYEKELNICQQERDALTNGQSLVIHQMRLLRTTIPDISLILLNSMTSLPKMVYINLTVMNRSIATLEHQNDRIQSLHDSTATTQIGHEIEINVTYVRIETLKFIMQLIETGKGKSKDPSLLKWLLLNK